MIFQKWLHRGILLAGLALFAAAAVHNLRSPLLEDLRQGRPIAGLVLGVDEVREKTSKRSDTLLFVEYHPAGRRLSLLSIPRDALVEIRPGRFRRINEVYAAAWRDTLDPVASCEQTMRAAEKLLGLAPGSVPYYVQVNYSAFMKIVDLVGGVTVEVPEPMKYSDEWGHFRIDLSSGVHHLDGALALAFVRYRDSRGDPARIFRQQVFLKRLLEKYRPATVFARLPGLIRTLREDVTTNLDLGEILQLGLEARRISLSDVRLASLPGRPLKSGGWMVDAPSRRRLAQTLLALRTGRPLPRGKTGEAAISVEIFNASGLAGAAERLRSYLVSRGVDVREWGNYSWRERHERTRLKDRVGDFEKAVMLRRWIGRGEPTTDIDLSRDVDVTIVIGQDFAGWKPPQ